MLEFLKRRVKREPGWLAISFEPGRLHFVHCVHEGGRNAIKRCGTQAFDDDKGLERCAKELQLHRHRCITILPATDYQLLLIDAPNVPAAELKNAAKWRVKDLLNYPVDQATLDVLDIPQDSGPSRTHSMYVVAAKNEVIQGCMQRFAAARIPLSVIDVEETAQRNIAALLEPSEGAVAMLYVGTNDVLLTVNFRAELYFARRIDASLEVLEKLAQGGSDEAKNRVLLEIQRSFDHLERQFPSIGVAKVVVAPMPADVGLQSYLADNLDVPVAEVRLTDLFDLAADVEIERAAAWRFFHMVGAALRNGGHPS